MRGWTHVTADQLRKRQPAKPSKYRNVKVAVDGKRFDSKREAEYWLVLKAREAAGEIRDLRRQVVFGLYAPLHGAAPGMTALVASYVADYTYVVVATGAFAVVDAKGLRTRLYLLKKKWLEIQNGIVIEEV